MGRDRNNGSADGDVEFVSMFYLSLYAIAGALMSAMVEYTTIHVNQEFKKPTGAEIFVEKYQPL